MTQLVPFLQHVAAELKRRRVLRVAAAYAAVGFVVAQVADIVAPALNLPAWTLTLVVVLLLLGFPLALALAWFFDITPTGVERTPASTSVEGTNAVTAAAPAAPASGVRRPLASRAGAIAAVAGALALAAAGSALVLRPQLPQASGPERDVTVVVLPFGSPDADTEYLSEGVAEAIMRRLNRVPGVRVISFTSALSYRGTSRRSREIAEELGVDHIVEGSVRRSGSQFRVSARLVDAVRDITLWSDAFDSEFSDVFAIETEIAEQVVLAMRVRLTPDQREMLASGTTRSVQAYDLHMQARKLWRENRRLDFTDHRSVFYSALALVRKAVEVDPDYALGWATLAEYYADHPDLRRGVRFDSAVAMAERAIRLAPHLADGYVALGTAHQVAQDRAAAKRTFTLALERDPNSLPALMTLSEEFAAELRLDDAVRLARRAAQLTPRSRWAPSSLATLYEVLGDFHAAEQWLRRSHQLAEPGETWALDCALARLKALQGEREAGLAAVHAALERGPDRPFVWNCAAMSLWYLGENEAAIDYLERFLASLGHSELELHSRASTVMLLALNHADGGNAERARTYLLEAEQLVRRVWEECPGTCMNGGLATVYAELGRDDEAVGYLQRAIDTGWTGFYPGDPIVARLNRGMSHNPRYQELINGLQARFDRQREALRREGL